MARELQPAGKTPVPSFATNDQTEFVTLRIDGQLFGIAVLIVQDVLRGLKMTHVPLAPKQVAGVLNLRGRIVTAIDMRECLGLPPLEGNRAHSQIMSVVVESKAEFFSLIVDSVGEVVSLPQKALEKNPANLSARWREVAGGVYKLADELLVILDVQKLLTF